MCMRSSQPEPMFLRLLLDPMDGVKLPSGSKVVSMFDAAINEGVSQCTSFHSEYLEPFEYLGPRGRSVEKESPLSPVFGDSTMVDTIMSSLELEHILQQPLFFVDQSTCESMDDGSKENHVVSKLVIKELNRMAFAKVMGEVLDVVLKGAIKARKEGGYVAHMEEVSDVCMKDVKRERNVMDCAIYTVELAHAAWKDVIEKIVDMVNAFHTVVVAGVSCLLVPRLCGVALIAKFTR
uniref:AlNc14C115G6509 protein n=1 Tax=Albugo laibachii Nc14 TaxID=890382 RepID=F0WIX3_9STRA|nr:AlNc14C115G6509 [Albugo laibachii Nc14]|eukprot:CCA21219.1 AlNc14C115G6509 [Albugo laibachii Nc14]